MGLWLTNQVARGQLTQLWAYDMSEADLGAETRSPGFKSSVHVVFMSKSKLYSSKHNVGEAWSAVIHGVAKSRTRLSDWTELKHSVIVSIYFLRGPFNVWIQNALRSLTKRLFFLLSLYRLHVSQHGPNCALLCLWWGFSGWCGAVNANQGRSQTLMHFCMPAL